jgi:RNA polymerase sigma factor (sigma-70 family)
MTQTTDDWGILLGAALDGDSRTYARFLREVTPVLRGVVRSRGAALGDAGCEDVLQDVLLALHLKRHTWQAGTPVRPWLYAIARYKVVDAFRARGRRIDLPIEDFVDVLPADGGEDPMQSADMDKMIALLDPRAQRLVRHVGVEGDSMAEAGEKLNMTEGAVRVALHRAFKQLAILRKRHVE